MRPTRQTKSDARAFERCVIVEAYSETLHKHPKSSLKFGSKKVDFVHLSGPNFAYPVTHFIPKSASLSVTCHN
ncbi:hypothetical protein L596_010279 [Steinernema carpocapsae]|uniref:Uncharacterized protein n=1 Tax=Steinernema carpocapsae TaxID=34508 RepID=A0A4U5PI52_STECR|nr:hypothetical protein L596_010279 [Steinernema carpocapsae]